MPPATDSLLNAFQQLTDPRDPRGVRHPFAGLLAVTFLGLLSRQPDFASIARWASPSNSTRRCGATWRSTAAGSSRRAGWNCTSTPAGGEGRVERQGLL